MAHCFQTWWQISSTWGALPTSKPGRWAQAGFLVCGFVVFCFFVLASQVIVTCSQSWKPPLLWLLVRTGGCRFHSVLNSTIPNEGICLNIETYWHPYFQMVSLKGHSLVGATFTKSLEMCAISHGLSITPPFFPPNPLSFSLEEKAPSFLSCENILWEYCPLKNSLKLYFHTLVLLYVHPD